MYRNVQSKIAEKMNVGGSTAVREIREQLQKQKAQRELNMILQSSNTAYGGLELQRRRMTTSSTDLTAKAKQNVQQ